MIREMERRDVWACREIVRLNWGDAVAEKFFDEVQHAWLHGMKWPPMYFVYVDERDSPMGFAGMMWSWIMTGVMDFIWVNVHPDHQGKDVGTALTEHRINLCYKMGVSVIHLMTKRVEFFKRFSFHPINYYSGNPPGWTLMTRQLSGLQLDDE